MTFSEWLASRGINEKELEGPTSKDRFNQLKNFFDHDQEELKNRPETAEDADGAEIKVGDEVTITRKVTAIHHSPDNPALGVTGRKHLSLARVLPGGVELHDFNVDAATVKKGQSCSESASAPVARRSRPAAQS